MLFIITIITISVLTGREAEGGGAVVPQAVGPGDEVGHGHEDGAQRGDDDGDAHHARLVPPGPQVADDQAQDGRRHVVRAGHQAHRGAGQVEATLDGRGVDVVDAVHHKAWIKANPKQG